MPAESVRPDALWDPLRNRNESRLLFLARPGVAVNDGIDRLLATHPVGKRLGRAAVPRANRHQSLSDRYVDTPEIRERMMRAGESFRAQALTLAFERLCSGPRHPGSHLWLVRPTQRSSKALQAVLRAINTALAVQGLPPGGGHAPHITLSYSAALALAGDEPIAPIEWSVDTIELVAGGGSPYRYETLGSWRLAPEPPRLVQSSLF